MDLAPCYCSFNQGNLKGYDHTINLVLEGCKERIYSQQRGVEQARLRGASYPKFCDVGNGCPLSVCPWSTEQLDLGSFWRVMEEWNRRIPGLSCPYAKQDKSTMPHQSISFLALMNDKIPSGL